MAVKIKILIILLILSVIANVILGVYIYISNQPKLIPLIISDEHEERSSFKKDDDMKEEDSDEDDVPILEDVVENISCDINSHRRSSWY